MPTRSVYTVAADICCLLQETTATPGLPGDGEQVPATVCATSTKTHCRCLLKPSDSRSRFTGIALFCSNACYYCCYYFKNEDYSPNQQLELKACLLSLLCLVSAGWSNYTKLKKKKERKHKKKNTSLKSSQSLKLFIQKLPIKLIATKTPTTLICIKL